MNMPTSPEGLSPEPAPRYDISDLLPDRAAEVQLNPGTVITGRGEKGLVAIEKFVIGDLAADAEPGRSLIKPLAREIRGRSTAEIGDIEVTILPPDLDLVRGKVPEQFEVWDEGGTAPNHIRTTMITSGLYSTGRGGLPESASLVTYYTSQPSATPHRTVVHRVVEDLNPEQTKAIARILLDQSRAQVAASWTELLPVYGANRSRRHHGEP